MYQEQFDELKATGKLPTPSGLGMKVLVLTQDEDCSLQEVVQTIQADRALAERIVKIANSAYPSRHGKIGTARDAAIRIGLRTVCSTALGFTIVAANRAGRSKGFDYDRFWSRSLATAVAAQIISRELSIGVPAEIFTCALLSRIGQLALASVYPTEYSEILADVEGGDSRTLATLERERFQIDHRELAAAMLEDWGMPPAFSEVALYFGGGRPPVLLEHDETRSLLSILEVSSEMAEVVVADEDRQPHTWATLKERCAGLSIEASQVRRIFDMVIADWTEWGVLLGTPTNSVLSADEVERRANSAAEQLRMAGPGAPGQTRLKILAVDDDPLSLRLLVSLLERSGHQVLTAHNGKEALAIALEKKPQMVVTDWMMPEMDGLELCKRLRRLEIGRNLYILVLTGRAEADRIVEAFDAGADDYIVKPFNPKLLSARIKPGVRVILLQEENDRQVKIKEELNARLSIEKRKLKAAAMTDALTELPNRRYAMRRLEKEWANSLRSGLPLSVIMLDIDHFKAINDTWGHDVGDAVLQATAREIQAALRRGDTCARIGGEEFLVICPNTDSRGTLKVAERIRDAIQKNVVQYQNFRGRVTISLGVGIRTPEIPTIDALLKMADEAVYEAKRAGRDRIAIGRPPGPDKRTA